MKPKVVILSAFLSPLRSGAEACVEEVSLRLADRYDITIITAKMRSDLPREDMLNGEIPVRRIGFGRTFDKWLFPLLAPIMLRRYKPELVHAVLETFAGLALYGTRFTCPKAKRLLTLQTTNRTLLKCSITRSAHAVTAISSALVEIAKGFECSNVVHIPNGIDVSRLAEATKRHTKVPGRLLFVGRVEPMKGIDVLLHALAHLIHSTQYDIPGDTHLRIVGDGSKRAEYEKLAQDLHLSDRVEFVGFVPVPEVFNEYAQAEIFCGLSRSEALGNVFLEAQGAGCSILGTYVGGIPDIVKDGEVGFLVPSNDVDAAADTLARLLDDPDLRRSFGENGLKNAAQYDWSDVADRYAESYQKLLAT